MNILLQKGSQATYQYSSTDHPVLSDDWVGSVSLFATYPSATATFTKPMTRVGNVFTVTYTAAEILNLLDGIYTLESTIANAVMGVAITSIDYATVLPINISTSPTCKIFGTIAKPDGTPTGSAISALANTTSGLALQAGWRGVAVNVSSIAAAVDASKIVSIERLTTQTNAAGYFEVYVIRGLTVNVTCASFGKTVQVDTTGLTEKDLSSYF